jgi:endogenous inhibitor of DNA gyrase (YacG/DUF329 family)
VRRRRATRLGARPHCAVRRRRGSAARLEREHRENGRDRELRPALQATTMIRARRPGPPGMTVRPARSTASTWWGGPPRCGRSPTPACCPRSAPAAPRNERRRASEAAFQDRCLWGVFCPDSNGSRAVTKAAAARVAVSMDDEERLTRRSTTTPRDRRSVIPRSSGYARIMASAAHEWPCPRCAAPVSVTGGNREVGDQLAMLRRQCPSCGAPLVHVVEGHVDRGWRVDEAPAEGD